MLLPEEKTDEPPYAPKDGTTSCKSTPLSRLPCLLAFVSEPFIQQTLFKRETDCTFDLPHNNMWNKNIYSVSDTASGSKNAKRDTRPSDATDLRCCNTCVQWKTPERDFTEDSSLSAISKRESQPTCFNSADIAYKPHKEALVFQRQDERLSSSTFHDLLQSSWMSANLHCSMLHFNTNEHAASFVERQMPNLSPWLQQKLRCEDLYRFRLQLRCLRMWNNRLRFLSQACCHDRRRALSKALYALRWAINMYCAQTDAVERRRSAFQLCQSFYQWKNRYESRHLKNSLHNESNTDALRKRLIQPGRTLVMRTTCSTWRNLDVLRTAVIHHHLSILYKHWLFWRQVCLKRISGRQQEFWACVWWDRRLQSRAWNLWTLIWQRKQLATHQYRMHLLSSAWTEWKIRNSQKKLENLIQSVQRSNLLNFFYLWQKKAETRKKRQRKTVSVEPVRANFNILKDFDNGWRTLHSWHCYVQKKKLTRLSTRAPWMLSRWMLAVTFRKWRDVTETMQDTRRCLERVRLLLDKGRMQTAFTIWRKSTRLRKELRRIWENSQRAQLSLCLLAWRTLVQRSALLLRYYHQRNALTLKACLHHWSRSLQLLALHKHFLIQQFHTRQRHTGKIVACMMELLKWKTGISPEVLSARLLLHNTLHNWMEILEKHQLAKFHRSDHDRALQRAVLLEWYRFTQAGFSDEVLLFTDRLALLQPSSAALRHSDPLMSTAVPQGKIIVWWKCVDTHKEALHCPLQAAESQHRSALPLLSFLGRMMHPDLSLALSQWRSLVHTNREMRLQADLCRNIRRLKELTVLFRVWKAQTQMHRQSLRHWERRVLFQFVIQLKQMVWQRRNKCMLEQQAAVTHETRPHCEQQKCAVEWITSRTERHRLNLSFSTWVTRVHQQQTARAIYNRTLLNSVFLGWLRCIQVCKQRLALALYYAHYRHLRVCFCQWRIICAQQWLANIKAQHTLHQRAKAILQQWRKHTHFRVCRHALLCEYDERRKTVMKRRSFLMWSQAVESFRRAQHYHQRALKHRCFHQWLHEFSHQSELLCVSRGLEEVWTQRLQQRAFSLWQLKLSNAHSHLHQICCWRDMQHLRLYLSVWRERLVERKRARLAVLRWRWHISRVKKQRNIMWRMRNTFLCWKAAFRQRVRSRDHWTQTQQRRVLLAWHGQTVSVQRLRYREAWFQYSSEMRLQANVFMQWSRAQIEGQQKQCALERLLIICQSRVSDRAFHRWRTAATEWKTITTFNNKLLNKWFKCWKHSRDLLKVADMFYVKKKRNKAQFVLRTWSMWAKERKAQRQMEEAVGLWLEGREVSRTFHHWVKVYQQQQKASGHRHTQLSHSITAVERRGAHGLTRLYWTCWKNQTEASLLCTQQYEHHVLQRAWLTWRKRHISVC
ncbi:hypothetical protein Q8A67_010467 [Cirrhinus molitorella]|uniref:Uncharacterized protein n=1 Tax=Cirrhinus molitorella TaxID=172907 RepID=A0AA88PWZ9_9TELE|nr:hypothetical protein Q8A67_010467 [Cirrhinus molitorella]